MVTTILKSAPGKVINKSTAQQQIENVLAAVLKDPVIIKDSYVMGGEEARAMERVLKQVVTKAMLRQLESNDVTVLGHPMEQLPDAEYDRIVGELREYGGKNKQSPENMGMHILQVIGSKVDAAVAGIANAPVVPARS